MEIMGIMRWAFLYAYQHLFNGDIRQMAYELKVGEDVLKRVLNKDYESGALIVFEQLAEYCLKHDISLDLLLAHYPNEPLE